MKQLIVLTMVSTLFFFGCAANNAGDGNHCTEADILLGVTTYMGKSYITITDQAGLQAIASGLSDRYILCADIDTTSTFAQINPDTDNTNTNTFDGDEFTGILDGNNKTISNLKIQATSSDFVGLFGQIAANGEVRNLKISLVDGDIDNPSILGAKYVGALAGRNEGTITNVRVIGGYVKGAHYHSGGLVGYNVGTIKQSSATGQVEGPSSIGGLAGSNIGTIKQSSATGQVTGITTTGGLVGVNDADGNITASFATGSVTGNNGIGGLVGSNNDGSITNSYATGAVEGIAQIGGLAGFNGSTITASYFDAELTGQGGAGTAYHTYTDPVDGDGLVYTQANGTGDKIDQSNFPNWNFDTIWAWQEEGRWPLLQFQTMTTQ